MSFNDDEPIVAVQDVSGEKPAPLIIAGKTKVKIINQKEAPLDESKFKVMIELTGARSGKDRSGVDLVIVIDISGSMEGAKLEKAKISMQFVIKKLSSIDRLSIVTFASFSKRLCPLRQITETSQEEIINIVNALVANGGTNITAGLQTGLKVLNDRNLTSGRVVGIMLMSDGQQNEGGNATQVVVGNLPVYTFGFGEDQDPMVLKLIADNSIGGTFSDVQNQDNLCIAFSQCLAGLLTVVVQDLKLTVKQLESTIEKVSAGSYPQSRNNTSNSTVTVSFGDLYNKELRKVIVDLLLPAVSSQRKANVLEITCTYSIEGKLFDIKPIIITITRTRKNVNREREEVMIEENRLQTAQMIKETRVMADNNKLDDAQEKLVQAQKLLEHAVDGSNPTIEMLKFELQQLAELIKQKEIYEKQGRPFALSSETSHDRQRFATRGDVEKLRLFATPHMDTFLQQAKPFVEDPSKPLPTVDEDVEKELGPGFFKRLFSKLSDYCACKCRCLCVVSI